MQRPAALPRPRGAGLAARVGQLYARHGPLQMNEPRNACQRLNVRIAEMSIATTATTTIQPTAKKTSDSGDPNQGRG